MLAVMEPVGFPPSAPALAAAAHILQAPLPEVLTRLSAALARPVPHRAIAELATQCSESPFRAAGEEALAGRINGTELGHLLGSVVAGVPWQGTARIAGADLPVLAVASDYTSKGALLVLVLQDERPLDAEHTGTVQALWDLITSHLDRLSTQSVPGALAQSRAAAGARTRAVAELGEAHAAALAGLLGVLRSRRLGDEEARAMAVDLAVTALVELRSETERERTLSEEPAGQAFGRLADSLRPLLRYSPVELELGPPGDDSLVPPVVAHAMRASVRAVVLAVLRQDGLGRLRVGWQLHGGELRATVRDDGPGLVRDDLAMCAIAERVEILGGRFEVDAVPDWGMTVAVTLPLFPPEVSRPGWTAGKATAPGTGGQEAADPLAGLGPRELQVLQHLALGHRNRTIAQQLHIGESTVKFHVANILTKLGVASRGEAAAFFHAAAVA
jgi:DNA-binding CsgD family transcriptional regulator